jgi:hypothetical protein
MVLIYRADLEKYGVEDDLYEVTDSFKRPIDPFFLKARPSMSSRFVPKEKEEAVFKRTYRKRW